MLLWNKFSVKHIYIFLPNFSLYIPQTIYPQCQICPICGKKLTNDTEVRKLLHTTLGTFYVNIGSLRCKHRVNGVFCGTKVKLNTYTYNSNKYIFRNLKPKYILVGKNHVLDVFYLQYFITAQFLHGNGTHMMAQTSKIVGKHEITPFITNNLQGSKKILLV